MGLGGAKGVVDGILEGDEGGLRFLLRRKVACDSNINYTAGGDIWREKNGGEFDLWKELSSA